MCGGIKDENGNWNTAPHKERIVLFGEDELKVLSQLFDSESSWTDTKLVSVHSMEILNVLRKLSQQKLTISDCNVVFAAGFHETNDVDRGIIRRNTKIPNFEDLEMILSGPHIYLANPIYKTPRSRCLLNSDYDSIDLSAESDPVIRTNYVPATTKEEFKKSFRGLPIGQSIHGETIYSDWFSSYKLAFREMVGSTSERTFSGAIIPPGISHIYKLVSLLFPSQEQMIEFAGLSFSLPMDFYVKILGIVDMTPGKLGTFPLGIDNRFKNPLFVRTLLLNCLTKHYADLWQEMWKEEYMHEVWSIEDKRLKPFVSLTEQWQWSTPLRNYFERRQALVEIDVIAAMALGLSLQDLEMIYTIQFPVLQQNENDTWYDAEGKIVFTCSRGLTGVGLDRPAWNAMRGNPITDADGTVIAYEGAEPQYTHTIDPRKSELYGGQQQTFIAPYNRCDRIADYRNAWAHFEKIFN